MILSRWNDKLTSYTLKADHDMRAAYGHDVKSHSIITVFAIFVTYGLFGLFSHIRFDHPYLQTFIFALQALLAIFCITLYAIAIYHWRLFFRLRRDGHNKDKNLFFAESAGLYRKIAFYIALAIDSVRQIQSHIYPEDIGQRMRRLKFQLRSEYYHDIGIAILESIILSILFIEFMRIIFPNTFSWSDKKHAVVVILISLAISSFKVFALNLTSGHGVF